RVAISDQCQRPVQVHDDSRWQGPVRHVRGRPVLLRGARLGRDLRTREGPALGLLTNDLLWHTVVEDASLVASDALLHRSVELLDGELCILVLSDVRPLPSVTEYQIGVVHHHDLVQAQRSAYELLLDLGDTLLFLVG